MNIDPDFILTCRCGNTQRIPDGNQIEVAAAARRFGWTTPGPFTDECPDCTLKAQELQGL